MITTTICDRVKRPSIHGFKLEFSGAYLRERKKARRVYMISDSGVEEQARNSEHVAALD